MSVLNYMAPCATQTLREGISELRLAEGQSDMSELGALTPQMTPHDAVHVLFGCGTSLLGEIEAHFWMLLATTIRLGEMHKATRTSDHQQVLRAIGLPQLLLTWMRAIPRLISILFRSRRMTQR